MEKKREGEKDLVYHVDFREQTETKIERLDPRDRELVRKFIKQKAGVDAGPKRCLKLVHTLSSWRQFLPAEKRWDELTKEDVVDAVNRLNESPKYKENTRRDFKKIAKMFIRFVKGVDVDPPETAWMKRMKEKANLQPAYQAPLSEDDLNKIIDACDDTKMRAFVSVLFNGFRIGEILPCRLRDCRFEEFGVRLSVGGKTGPRPVLLNAKATPYVSAWRGMHRQRENPDAFLFPNREGTLPMPYRSARNKLLEYAKRAGISKKVNPGWFRVSSITDKLVKKNWSVVEVAAYHGNNLNTIQRHYLKMSARDTDAAVLREQGPKTQECPRCKAINGDVDKQCTACGALLDVRYEAEAVEQKKFALELLMQMLRDENKKKELLATLEKEVAEIEQVASGQGNR